MKGYSRLSKTKMRLRGVEYKISFISKPYSRILSVVINIVYVNLVTQVGFFSKSQTYDSHGIEE